jgi:hypothetical protein
LQIRHFSEAAEHERFTTFMRSTHIVHAAQYKLEMPNTRLFPSVCPCKPLLLRKHYLENTWSLGMTQHALSAACDWPDQLNSPEEKLGYGAVKPGQAATPYAKNRK